MARKSNKVVQHQQCSPDDEAACFSEYGEKRGEMARISGSIAKMLDRYKKMGVDTAAIKYAYAESQKEKPTERHKSRTGMLVRLQIIEWEESGQSSLAPGLSVEKMSPESQEKIKVGRARRAGYMAGKAGGLVDSNPHQPGTSEYVGWREQFFMGQSDRPAGQETIVKASPRKRASKRVEDSVGQLLN